MKTKRDSTYSRQHTIQRLQERYDLNITNAEYETLCLLIRAGKGEVVEEEADMHQKIITLRFKNQRLLVVWDTIQELVRTALPKPT